jgi:hypothetical protein
VLHGPLSLREGGGAALTEALLPALPRLVTRCGRLGHQSERGPSGTNAAALALAAAIDLVAAASAAGGFGAGAPAAGVLGRDYSAFS